jgi:hypothetical protein
LPDVGRLRSFREVRGIDAHGKGGDGDATAKIVGVTMPKLEMHEMLERGDAVPGVVAGVYTDQIGPEEPGQNSAAPRQQSEHVERREWDVEKKADPALGQLLANHEHQLIVVDQIRSSAVATASTVSANFRLTLRTPATRRCRAAPARAGSETAAT